MERLGYKELRAGIIGAYNNLENNKEIVNGLNVFPVPDGDTGTNMSLTMKSVMNKLQLSEDNIPSIAKALGTGSLMGARGNSGVILSQLCRGITLVFEKLDSITIIDLVEALEKAKETAYKAVLKPTEGTVLTVARMMAEYARNNYKNYTEIDVFIKDIIAEGDRVLSTTPDMLPVLKEAGVVDAGGKGLIVLLEGFLSAITGKEINFKSVEYVKAVNLGASVSHHSNVKPEDIEFGYCTEFLINHDGSQSFEEFKEIIQEFGDSIVCVGADNLIKTHIHTNNPGHILELALQRGFLSDIKIENMRVQNAQVNELQAMQQVKSAKKKKYGFVSISIGEGFDKIFKDLHVDELISGGQTMNPSTEDIVEAVDKVSAETVFVFPNNKNIILAAKQAVELVENKELVVVETKSIPEAFTALLNFDEESSAVENLEMMTESMGTVETLQLTYAVRDTKNGELEIKENDIIGIKGKEIVVNGKEVEETMLKLIEKSITEYSGLLTVYAGEEVSDEDMDSLLEKLEEKYEDLDVQMIRGGQPLYYYIASVE